MTAKDRLWKIVARSVERHAWHGPSVLEAISGVTAAQAAARPAGRAHTIWELLLHVAAWMDEAAERLAGRHHEAPLAGDWPPVPEPNEANWAAARQHLLDSLERLGRQFAEMPEEDLMSRAHSTEGPSVIIFDMMAGVAAHNAYHAGQIVLLKKALDAAP